MAHSGSGRESLFDVRGTLLPALAHPFRVPTRMQGRSMRFTSTSVKDSPHATPHTQTNIRGLSYVARVRRVGRCRLALPSGSCRPPSMAHDEDGQYMYAQPATGRIKRRAHLAARITGNGSCILRMMCPPRIVRIAVSLARIIPLYLLVRRATLLPWSACCSKGQMTGETACPACAARAFSCQRVWHMYSLPAQAASPW